MKLPQTERSLGSTSIVAVLLVVSLILMTVYAREGDRGALRSVRRGVQAVTAPVAAAGTWATTPLRRAGAWASGLGASRQEIEELREQNDALRVRVADLEEARLENERLASLVGFIDARQLDAVGARVIAGPTSSWEAVITIDRGTDDGVRAGMPVMAPQGLLGQTIEVTGNSSRVRLITDQRSGVAALIQSNRAQGVVRGTIDGGLSMEYVSREATVVPGDIVLTSGMGGVYPKGLLLGEVGSVSSPENALFSAVTIVPAASVRGLEEVIVLVGAAQAPEVGEGE